MKGELRGSRYYVKVGEEMVWPSVSDKVSELEWRLRYAKECVSSSDMLILASLVSAYRELILCEDNKRKQVCQIIKKASLNEK